MSSFLASDKNAFKYYYDHVSPKAAMHMFHAAFVFKRGVMHDLPENRCEEMEKHYFLKVYRFRQAADDLVELYQKSTNNEKRAITNYFRSRENWLPTQHTFKTTCAIADILLGRPGSFLERLKIGCRLKKSQDLDISFPNANQFSVNGHRQVIADSIKVRQATVSKAPEYRFAKEIVQEPRRFAIAPIMNWAEWNQVGDFLTFMNAAEREKLLLDAVGEKKWDFLKSAFQDSPCPRDYFVLRKLNAKQLTKVLTLVTSKNRPVLQLIYDTARYLPSKKVQTDLVYYLKGILHSTEPSNLRKTSTKQDKSLTSSSNGVGPLQTVPEELLSLILYQSIDSIGYSEFVLRRVCKRWNSFLTADKVIINSLPVARLFVDSLRVGGLVEPWKSFKEIRTTKSCLVVSILCKWTLNELDINPSDCDWFIDNVYDDPNIDPFDYALMIKKMSASLPKDFDFDKQESWMDYFPKCFTMTDMQTFIDALLRDGRYPRFFKTKPQVSVYILGHIISNRIEGLTEQIVKQTDRDNESLLLLLIDHGLDKCYNEDALCLLVPNYIGPIDSISHLLEKIEITLPDFIKVLLSRLLIRCTLNRQPCPKIKNAVIREHIVFAAMLESKDAVEFKTIFPHIVEAFKFSDEELRKLAFAAVSKLIMNE